jgi:glycine C-acetyltransferase
VSENEQSVGERAARFREDLRRKGVTRTTAPEDDSLVSENFDLLAGSGDLRKLPLAERTALFARNIGKRCEESGRTFERQVVSPMGREVLVLSDRRGSPKPMLMFGSNSYLGFANDAYVKDHVRTSLDKWGAGAGGPPAINGYTGLTNALEARLAALKGAEDAMVFPSGYAANLALATSLARPQDLMAIDSLSHASFLDGLALAQLQPRAFRHSDLRALENLLAGTRGGQSYVAIEGVYSMEGDIAPLEGIVALARRYKATIILDDAHGTGVLGQTGSGTAEHCSVHGEIDISMGTFSKVFGVTGGFVAGSRDLIRYLRFSARSYIFSAALAPTVLAAVHAGIDLIEREPERRQRLFANVDYLVQRLRQRGFSVHGETPIVSLKAPPDMDMYRGCALFEKAGIFLCAMEHPVVPRNAQSFRLSLMSEHTDADLDSLLRAIDIVWSEYHSKRKV